MYKIIHHYLLLSPWMLSVLTAPLVTHPSRRLLRLNVGQEVVGWRQTSWQKLLLCHSGHQQPLHLLDPSQIYLRRGHSALIVCRRLRLLSPNQRDASPFRRMASLLKRSDMKSPPLDAAATAGRPHKQTKQQQ